ncbi:MAG: RsmB/NOP family class I SAM-dependent RNA methyltransferase [Acutalibacteraceae bacterium]
MIDLPLDFVDRMKKMLGAQYDDFLQYYATPAKRGLRVNTLKADIELIKSKISGIGEKSPFCSENYYINEDEMRLGNHPFHHAGAYYLQEPSASCAVEILAPEPYDKVLDLCAAPGGKSTQIGAHLQGKGILWSNEIVKNRAGALLSNIERMGIRNCVVSSCHPQTLCDSLEGYFDKVLVDAPCSGEGMFGKNPDAAQQWSVEHVCACADRQLSILNSAKQALKPGGVLVYSTCTFSYEENEGVIERFLSENSNFEPEACNVGFGRPDLKTGLARRIFPMDGGEGHFVAKLRKKDGDACGHAPINLEKLNKSDEHLVTELFKSMFNIDIYGDIYFNGDKAYILPDELPDIRGLGVLRAGVCFGERKKNRIEPMHSVYLASKISENNCVIDLDCDDERVVKFLHGEEISVDAPVNGFTALAVNGIITGFGKYSNGTLKNRYPKGLRIL